MTKGIAEPRPVSRMGFSRWPAIIGVATRMMFYDRLKLVGALLGVVFATFLTGQQLGIFMGLVTKNTLLADNVQADIWITPPNTRQTQAGPPIAESRVYEARAVRGVAWADPMLWAGASLSTPGGVSEPVSLIGLDARARHGTPWNVVAGDPTNLDKPNAVFVEASFRDRFGNANLGSLREINGRQVHIVGLTSGLQGFAPPFAWADLDLAREIAGQRTTRDPNFILVGVRPGEDPVEVAARLQAALPDTKVFTREELRSSIINFITFESPIGASFFTSALFGVIVGFVIVALTMFSAVVDNLKEYGTLKAIGATNWDLARMLLVQAVTYGVVGSLLGVALTGFAAAGIRSPDLTMILPVPFVAGLPVFMVGVCVVASSLALLRLRGLEPAIVFRG